MRLFGAVAAVFRERFLPYVPRVVQNVIRRFNDPEGSVLEACAEALGAVAAHAAAALKVGGGFSLGGAKSSLSDARSFAA